MVAPNGGFILARHQRRRVRETRPQGLTPARWHHQRIHRHHDPYDIPTDAEVTIDTLALTAEEAAQKSSCGLRKKAT